MLACVAAGFANKEIAAALGISESGAKKHANNLRRRYGVNNRVSLVIAALRAGDLDVHAFDSDMPSTQG